MCVVVTCITVGLCLLCGTQAALVSYSFLLKKVPSNPDGYPRAVIGVFDDPAHHGGKWNTHRPFPGPTIRGKLGDTVTVKVKNGFDDDSTSLHFHGLHMLNNPWMDGVAEVTQPAILPGHTFTYRFNLTQTGTFWYHSHSGVQYGDGLLGPIVVDYPDDVPDPVKVSFPYTKDYTMLLQDWFHETGDDLLLNYRGPYDAFRMSHGQPFVPNYPWRAASVLINGRGQFDCHFDNTCVSFFRATPAEWFPYTSTCAGKTQCLHQRDPFFGPCDPTPHPVDEFKCEGQFTRLRLINGGTSLTLRFWIDHHNITVVARDGVETIPMSFRSVSLPVSQRLDVIVACTKSSMKYRMFVAPAYTFLPHGANNPKLSFFSSALLTYPNAITEAEVETAAPNGHGPEHEEAETFEYQLRPLEKKRRMTKAADHRIVLQYSEAYDINSGHPLEEWTVNNITHMMPTTPLLQEVYLGKSPNSTIAYHGKGSEGNLLQTHLIPLEFGKTYEVVMISMNPQQHPFHIHGYYVDFVATGELDKEGDFYKTLDICNYTRTLAIKQDVLDSKVCGNLPLDQPVEVLTVGDSFTVARMGYTIFRFTADNQGPWIMHCHVEWHIAQGMGVLFSVEKNGTYPDILPPPDDFPAYLPLKDFKKHHSSGYDLSGINEKGQNIDTRSGAIRNINLGVVVLGIALGLVMTNCNQRITHGSRLY